MTRPADGLEYSAYASKLASIAQERAMPTPGYKSPDFLPIHVETTVSPDALEQMLGRVEAVFKAHAKTRPHWAVLSARDFEPDRIDANRARFFQTGVETVATFQRFAARVGLDLAAYQTCFELGCGVGRCTIPLARLFPSTIGADIAEPMLLEGSRAAAAAGVSNIRWLLTDRFAVYDDLPPFDVLFTGIVLQHNAPPVMRWLLTKLLGKLRSGGIAYFQIPTYRAGYSFSAERYLASPGAGEVEMHVFPQRALFELLWRCGCQILEIREDGAAGEAMDQLSNTLLIEKK